MKTITDFNTETQDCACLEDFVLSFKEWSKFESGTKGIRVKTYNDKGTLVNREYVLCDIDNVNEVLEDMKAIANGYFTDTCYVIRK